MSKNAIIIIHVKVLLFIFNMFRNYVEGVVRSEHFFHTIYVKKNFFFNKKNILLRSRGVVRTLKKNMYGIPHIPKCSNKMYIQSRTQSLMV